MDTARKPANPFSSLFAGSEAAKVIDFLLSREQHQTMTEIHAGTLASMNRINKIMEYLLDIGAVGIGARRVKVLKIRKANSDKMIEVTGLDTVPSESDMNQYIEEVIKEMQANKEKR